MLFARCLVFSLSLSYTYGQRLTGEWSDKNIPPFIIKCIFSGQPINYMSIADFAVYVLKKVSGYADFETLNFLHIFIHKSRIAVLFCKFSVVTEKISFTLDNTTSTHSYKEEKILLEFLIKLL